MSNTNQELADLIWSVADLLRGDYKRSEYAKVILPLTVLRRFDCVMEEKGTREAVWKRNESFAGDRKDALLLGVSELPFFNTSRQNFRTISSDDKNVYANLKDYIRGFSPEVTEIIDRYDFHIQIERLQEADLLYLVVPEFAAFDLSPSKVSNHDMGYVFEELIRKFADASNETAGEHFTPREVIKLMVELLLGPDEELIRRPGAVIDILDPACGTGGMLAAAEEHIKDIKPSARVNLFGQEINAESYAICRSDMLLKGHVAGNIRFGNTFTRDWHEDRKFSYMLANPPFGVEWKKSEKAVREEHDDRGFDGRFGAGLPRINDGSFLFLQHMLHKMQPLKKDENGKEIGGSRIAIVFNGSPLFTGSAGSGESEIRRWILEHDYLETIVGLPDQLFYNTGISTYFWILSNRKPKHRKGKVVMIDARGEWVKRRKSLGEKRKEISEAQIAEICAMYRDAEQIAADENHPQHAKVKILRNEEYGYQRITVDRPLKLRFEITEDTLTELASSAALQKVLGDKKMAEEEVAKRQKQFVEALRPLAGQVWPTKSEAWDALHKAVVAAGLIWPSGAAFQKALRDAVGVRDPKGEVQGPAKQPEHDPDLRDAENVPMGRNIDEYLREEVRQHVEDAWIAELKNPKTKLTERSKVGYEIPFTRHFYVYEPPRPLAEIDKDLKSLEAEIQALLGKVTG